MIEQILIFVGFVFGAWSFFNLGRLWESLKHSREINDQIQQSIKRGKNATVDNSTPKII